MNEVFKDNPLVLEKHKDYTAKQRVYDKNRAEIRKTNDDVRALYNKRCLEYYHNHKEHLKNKRRITQHPMLLKINNYLSALNTGKIKTVNKNKIDEYHITFNNTLLKYEVDINHIRQYYKQNEKK